MMFWKFENQKIKIDRSIRNRSTKIVQLSDFERNIFWAQKVKFTIWPNLAKWSFSHFTTFWGPGISNLRVWHIPSLEMNNLIIRNRQISIYYHTSSFIHYFHIKMTLSLNTYFHQLYCNYYHILSLYTLK